MSRKFIAAAFLFSVLATGCSPQSESHDPETYNLAAVLRDMRKDVAALDMKVGYPGKHLEIPESFKATRLQKFKTAEIPLLTLNCDRNRPKTVTALHLPSPLCIPVSHLPKPSPTSSSLTSPQVPPIVVCCGFGIRLPSSRHPSLWSFPLCFPSVFFLHAPTSRLCSPFPTYPMDPCHVWFRCLVVCQGVLRLWNGGR